MVNVLVPPEAFRLAGASPSTAAVCRALTHWRGSILSCDDYNPDTLERRSFQSVFFLQDRERNMDKEHAKGFAEKTKGAVKEKAGKMTGDKKMEAEGKMKKAKGSAHNVAGDVKDAARDATRK